MPKISAIDLFCGGGGSSLGARAAGVEMVGAVDAWDVATQTYADNFPKAEVINARISARSGPRLFERVKAVDLIIASPECTHHSVARGAKPRDEESRRSGWYVLPFVRRFKPRWVVIENVSGMRRWDGFAELMEALGKDYFLRTQLLDAADFGTPQMRKRLFIVGDRLQKPPKIVGGGQSVDALSILDPLDSWPARLVSEGHLSERTLERIDRGIGQLGRERDFLVVYYSSDKAGGWQPLDRPIRTLTTVDRFGLVRWVKGEPTFRMLQISELRRAMGYPDDAKLNFGSRRDRVKLLGNGVCPPVMQKVIESLIGR